MTSGEGKLKLVGPAGPMRPEPSPPSPCHSSRSTPGRARISRARARPERSPAATGCDSPCCQRTSRAKAVQMKSYSDAGAAGAAIPAESATATSQTGTITRLAQQAPYR